MRGTPASAIAAPLEGGKGDGKEMSTERSSLGESFQDGSRSLRSLIPVGSRAKLAAPSKRTSDSFARPLIPAGPASAVAIQPAARLRAAS